LNAANESFESTDMPGVEAVAVRRERCQHIRVATASSAMRRGQTEGQGGKSDSRGGGSKITIPINGEYSDLDFATTLSGLEYDGLGANEADFFWDLDLDEAAAAVAAAAAAEASSAGALFRFFSGIAACMCRVNREARETARLSEGETEKATRRPGIYSAWRFSRDR